MNGPSELPVFNPQPTLKKISAKRTKIWEKGY
jgi:hypothetical protein